MNKTPWDPENEIEEIELHGIIRSRKVDDTSSSASEDDGDDAVEDDIIERIPAMDTLREVQRASRDVRATLDRQSFVVPEDWTKRIEDRLFRIEKDILVLHHKKEPPKSGISTKLILLVLVLAVLFQYWRG
jgi:hypothetical protein